MDRYLYILLISTIICICFKSATCLECYSCSNEHHNWMSCTKNIIQCARFQDACITYTSFHRFLEYTPRNERWHNISKGCDTMEMCQRRAAAINDALCERSSLHEWACLECCNGDLCNYFVTLGSPRMFGTMSQLILASACLLLSLVVASN